MKLLRLGMVTNRKANRDPFMQACGGIEGKTAGSRATI